MDATPTSVVMTTDMLQRLVSFDTSSRSSNLALIGFVPRRFGCGLSHQQRSCPSKGKFVRRDRPARSRRTGARPAARLATVVKQITGSNSLGKVGYGTEGGFYQDGGIPTILCGTGHIAQAHKSDEWVAESELEARDSFIRRLAKRLLA
jgi:acetylornithine deacetylase/succinyl-diaminopimelate desuccinylase-like protein